LLSSCSSADNVGPCRTEGVGTRAPTHLPNHAHALRKRPCAHPPLAWVVQRSRTCRDPQRSPPHLSLRGSKLSKLLPMFSALTLPSPLLASALPLPFSQPAPGQSFNGPKVASRFSGRSPNSRVILHPTTCTQGRRGQRLARAQSCEGRRVPPGASPQGHAAQSANPCSGLAPPPHLARTRCSIVVARARRSNCAKRAYRRDESPRPERGRD
jgi:hypothetical protein